VDMLHKIKHMTIPKFVERNKIARSIQGTILPSIIQSLNAQSKSIKYHEVLIVGGVTAEVIVSTIRYAVNLDQNTCSYRAWQMTGKPCNHALVVIAKLSREVQMEEFMNEYLFVDRLRKTYMCFTLMKSKHR
jgi:tRNA A37 threonylcarbamoyltransferase TsaD